MPPAGRPETGSPRARPAVAYERVRTLLREELGTAPGRELQALHAELLRG